MHSDSRLPRLLIVDDEPALREMLEILFRRGGYEPVMAAGYGEACAQISQSPEPFPVVLTDLAMPDGSGVDVLGAAKARSAATEVILLTAHSALENAVAAMKAGAFTFITKPAEPAELAAQVERALEKHSLLRENARLRAQIRHSGEDELVGRSSKMRAVFDLIDRVAATRTTVLITGESGTGKERIARAIHQRSDRADEPFLVVNCGALPEALMESELFGHEKGAFTGASSRQLGIFREAEGGTVMLDEVGELAPLLQVKLLRVLQERTIRAVGSAQEVPVNVRVLAATNRDVEAEVTSGKFRQDLYYRLNVIRVELPALRERREDIAALVERFIRRFAGEIRKDVQGLTPDALRLLEGYSFPGNVRELENMIERAVALVASPTIGLSELPAAVMGISSETSSDLLSLKEEGCDLDQILNQVELRLLLQALERTGGVRTNAAKLLGITLRSLRYRLQKHTLDAGDAAVGEVGVGEDDANLS
ncbi:MAG TPA: sigma-54 dependent transcriptional regulator [Polyangiaceae bacterium]|nr:sigma-54 dependent transcriptional regulator [Polyangiaceae bacterium]